MIKYTFFCYFTGESTRLELGGFTTSGPDIPRSGWSQSRVSLQLVGSSFAPLFGCIWNPASVTLFTFVASTKYRKFVPNSSPMASTKYGDSLGPNIDFGIILLHCEFFAWNQFLAISKLKFLLRTFFSFFREGPQRPPVCIIKWILTLWRECIIPIRYYK